MKSPKFAHLYPELSKCINKATLESTWKGKIGFQLRKQIHFDLVEYRDFKTRISSEIETLCQKLEKGTYRPHPTQTYLVEKSKGLCRQMTAMHPLDLLVMQVLSSFLYADLRKQQPTASAYFEPGEHKFNKGQLLYKDSEYGSIASWKRFQKKILEFSRERKWLVVTDIANFYDFINFRHLRNIVSSFCHVSESVLDLLLYILNEVSWTPDYMPRSEIGLPQIEAEAPRVLANAMLYELDRVANQHASGDYIRFMDDIDVGVDTLAHAKQVVRDIDLTLQTRQLRLNSSKTRILNAMEGEVSAHFCVKENKFLDSIAYALERNPKSKKPMQKALSRAYSKWRGSFDKSKVPDDCLFYQGNGSKIFKRVVFLSGHLDVQIPILDLLTFINREPGIRSHAFNALARNSHLNSALYKLIERFLNGDFVDDASAVYMTQFALHAKFVKNQKFDDQIKSFVAWCTSRDRHLFFECAFAIASKFFSTSEILEMATSSFSQWRGNFWLARCVSGLYPRMIGTSEAASFVQLVQRSDSIEAQAVLDFHMKLAEGEADFCKIHLGYLKSGNPTFPNKLIHSKVLILLSLYNGKFDKVVTQKIVNSHAILKADPFYRSWFYYDLLQPRAESKIAPSI